MKILYAVQGTGNGHLSRAKDVIPALMKRAQVDILISGVQADIDLPFPVKYRYKGLSFIFGKRGGVDMLATYRAHRMRRVWNEIRSCPVKDYDLVINDFEPISAWACRLKGVKSIGLSHQSALRSKKVPTPSHIDPLGWAVLKYYAPCHAYYSFHFKKYDNQIFTPIIRTEIREQEMTDQGHYTVYLPAYGDKKMIKILSAAGNTNWQVFSKHTKEAYQSGNIKIEPIHAKKFSKSLASATGVLCGAGFETPAEALYLNKKLLVIPMKRQFEQHFNAEGLKDLGVPVIKKLNKKNIKHIKKWVKSDDRILVHYPDETQLVIDQVLEQHIQSQIAPEATQSGFLSFFKLKLS